MKLKKNVSNTINSKSFKSITRFIITHKKGLKNLCFVLVCAGMIINGLAQIPGYVENKQEIADLEDAVLYEEERVKEVERLNDIIGTDEYIEKIARDKLGMVKEGEKLFVDVSKDN